MGTRAVERGEVAERVAAGVRTLREARGLSQRGLAELLAEHGRPVQVTALSKIETGERRVDVDDLVALALSLEVLPMQLLSGEADPMATPIEEIRRHEEMLAPIGEAAKVARDGGVPLSTIIAYLHTLEWWRPEKAMLKGRGIGGKR